MALPPGLVPEYIQDIQVYKSGKPIEELAREKNLTRISKLASNENPLGPSPMAIREMTNGLWESHRYPDQAAYRTKAALADLYSLKHENIILGNGSEGIMGYIARAFLQPGDTVLTSANTFIGFMILAKSTGANIEMTRMTKDYRFDVEAIRKSITDKTKVIYIANPNNPTGTYIKKSEFDYLMEAVPDRCLVLLDEAYFEYANLHEDYPDSMDYRYDNVITLRTFSKAYGIPGVRIGYGFAHEDLITALTKVKLPFEPSSIAQLGAYGAIQDQNHLQRTLELNTHELARLRSYCKLNEIPVVDSVTNFMLLECENAENAKKFNEELLGRGVIIRPMGGDLSHFVRVSIGTKDEMDHFFEAATEVRSLLARTSL